jgi:hypothetical protein
MTPTITLIISSDKRQLLLTRALNSVVGCEPLPTDVIVVDDAPWNFSLNNASWDSAKYIS